MVCSCFVFIRAQYSQSQCDDETSREGWVERGEKACWWVDYWRWRLVGPRRKRCRFENACYRKGDASHIHIHTHTHAYTDKRFSCKRQGARAWGGNLFPTFHCIKL